MTKFSPIPALFDADDSALDRVGIEIVHCAEDGTPARRDLRALWRFLTPLPGSVARGA